MCSVEVRQLIWVLYRPGQESDKRPTCAYLIAQRAAVAEVAYREGRCSAELAVEGVEEYVQRYGGDVTEDEFRYLVTVIPYDLLMDQFIPF
jgi:hypothetical protein